MMFDKLLSRFAQECVRLDADHWRLAMNNGRSVSLSVRRDDDFLLLDSAAGVNLTAESLLPLIESASEFPASVKFALHRGLHRGGPNLRLRSEFPLLDESEAPADRIQDHLEAMRSALHKLHDGGSCEAAAEEVACPAPQGDGRAIGSLVEIVKQAGWQYHERPGELLADLEAGGEFLQATVEPAGAGTRFSVILHRTRDSSDAAAQQALCLYLLEANAALRYVRAFHRHEKDEVTMGFEVCLARRPAADEAGHALAALSVAARQCSREVKVLGGSMAGIYRSARPSFFHNSKGV